VFKWTDLPSLARSLTCNMYDFCYQWHYFHLGGRNNFDWIVGCLEVENRGFGREGWGFYLTFMIFHWKADVRSCWSVFMSVHRGADKSLARPTSWCISFDGENI